MKLSKLQFRIDQPIEAAAIQNLTDELACLKPKLRRNSAVLTLVTWSLVIFEMLFLYLAVKYGSKLPPASLLSTLVFGAFWVYRIGVTQEVKSCYEKAEDSLRTADANLVGGYIDYLMRDSQCRRYIQAVAAQNRKLLTLEVNGMQAYCKQKEESEQLAQTRKKLEAVGLTGYSA